MPRPKPAHLPTAPNFSHPKPPGTFRLPGVRCWGWHAALEPTSPVQKGHVWKNASEMPAGNTSPPGPPAAYPPRAVASAETLSDPRPMTPRKYVLNVRTVGTFTPTVFAGGPAPAAPAPTYPVTLPDAST